LKRGVVYACSHERWFGEVLISAESCRQHMPDLAREIFITRDLHAAVGARLAGLFTQVIVLPEAGHRHRPRFEAALQTRLDEAIFIDGDTLFLGSVYELFDVFDHFDIAVALAPQYLSRQAVQLGVFDLLPKVAIAIPEWNGGVIAARVDDAFRAMVERWSALLTECVQVGFNMDQAALRSALVHSRLRIATLPNNYNFRALLAQSVTGHVKILHAHGELGRIARTINASLGIRLYTPRPEDIHGFLPK